MEPLPLPLGSGIPNRGGISSQDFFKKVTEVKVLVNASSSPDHSLFDNVAFPAALLFVTNLRSELRALLRT